MKYTISISGVILFTFIIALPLGEILSSYYGYTFELASYSLFAVITALLAVIVAVLCSIYKDSVKNTSITVLFDLVAPFSLINAAFYIYHLYNRVNVLVIPIMFICVCCCCYLTLRHGKPSKLKTVSFVLSALMVLPIGFFGFISLIFGNMRQDTVIKSIKSPNGTYYAELIDSDQGACGGDTHVYVYENKSIDAGIFKLSKKPQTVYFGDWGEYKNVKMYWKDDSCIVVNYVEHTIE